MSGLIHKLFDGLSALLFPLYELTGGIEGKGHKPPKKILLIKPDHLGDVVLTTPAIAAVHDHLPKAEIWYLAKSTSLPVLQNNPAISRLIEFNAPWCCRLGEKAMTIGELSKLSRLLRRERFDISVAFQDNARTHLFAAYCGIPRRLGYAPRGGKHLLTDNLPPPNEDEHAVISHNRLVKAIGAKPDEFPTQIFLTEEEEKEGKSSLAECSLLFHVGAAHAGKMVSVELGGRIMKAVAQSCHCKIALIGGKAEQERVKAIHSQCAEETKVVPTTSLRHLAALIKAARVFIGHDSGPGHISSAVSTNSVILFGQGNPTRWAPWGKLARVVRANDCKNIEAIEPKEVADIVKELLTE